VFEGVPSDAVAVSNSKSRVPPAVVLLTVKVSAVLISSDLTVIPVSKRLVSVEVRVPLVTSTVV
jgi:hypothetical protein